MPKALLPKPDQKINPSDDIEDYNCCIYGTKGSGKTLLASSFPGSITMRWERGRKNVNILQYPAAKSDPPLDWERFLSLTEQFCESDYRRMNIDHIDGAWTACKRYVLDTIYGGVKSADELGKSSYHAHVDSQAEWAGLWDTIMDHGKTVTWLTHCKTRSDPDPRNVHKTIDRLEFTCEPAAGAIIKERADIVWFLQKYGSERLLSINAAEGSPSEINTQIKKVCRTPDGSPLGQIRLPHVEEEDSETLFQTIQDAWDNKLYNYDPEDPDGSIAARKRARQKSSSSSKKRAVLGKK